MNEKISIHEKNFSLTKRLEGIKTLDIPDSVKIDLFQFIDDLKSGQVNRGKNAVDNTCIKYIAVLRHPLKFINKPLDKITREDVLEFHKAISLNKILSGKNKPFAQSMKVDMSVALKILLSWKIGKEKVAAMTDFLETRDKPLTPEYLKEQEVESLFKGCKTNLERYVLAVLFDSGARSEEFMNIRYEDIQLPEGKSNFVRLTLKQEYSKTMGRNIPLLWKHSLEAVRDYLNERIKEGIKPKEPIIKDGYNLISKFISRLGKRVINQHVYIYLLRHSSATFYATKLNRQELCYRYGWKFSSEMPDVYISRAGMVSNEIEERFTSTELGELKEKLEKQEQENRIMKEKINYLTNQFTMFTSLNKKQKENLEDLNSTIASSE